MRKMARVHWVVDLRTGMMTIFPCKSWAKAVWHMSKQ